MQIDQFELTLDRSSSNTVIGMLSSNSKSGKDSGRVSRSSKGSDNSLSHCSEGAVLPEPLFKTYSPGKNKKNHIINHESGR